MIPTVQKENFQYIVKYFLYIFHYIGDKTGALKTHYKFISLFPHTYTSSRLKSRAWMPAAAASRFFLPADQDM